MSKAAKLHSPEPQPSGAYFAHPDKGASRVRKAQTRARRIAEGDGELQDLLVEIPERDAYIAALVPWLRVGNSPTRPAYVAPKRKARKGKASKRTARRAVAKTPMLNVNLAWAREHGVEFAKAYGDEVEFLAVPAAGVQAGVYRKAQEAARAAAK